MYCFFGSSAPSNAPASAPAHTFSFKISLFSSASVIIIKKSSSRLKLLKTDHFHPVKRLTHRIVVKYDPDVVDPVRLTL